MIPPKHAMKLNTRLLTFIKNNDIGAYLASKTQSNVFDIFQQSWCYAELMPTLKHTLGTFCYCAGTVHIKERVDSLGEVSHNLLKEGAQFEESELPDVVTPAGLSAQRQWYLYDKIREFCPESNRDVTCPLPSVPKPTSRHGTPEIPPSRHSRSRSRSRSRSPPPKRPRRCTRCHRSGHNSRSCPQQ